MKCPKCKDNEVLIQMVSEGAKTKKKKNSIIRSMARATMVVGTGGAWALTPKHDGKEKTKQKLAKMAICQNCGHSWEVK